MTQSEMDRPQHVLVGLVMPAALVLSLIVPYLVLRSGLPDPMAVRFRSGGATDAIPIGLYLALVTAVVAACVAVLVAATRRPQVLRGIEAPLASFVGWTAVITHTWVLVANDGAATWQEVSMGSGASIGAAGGALGLSLPIIMLMRRARSRSVGQEDALTFGRDERVAWFGSSTSRILAITALVMTGAGAAAILGVSRALDGGLGLVLAGFLIAQFMCIDVTINDDGVTLRTGPLRWPRRHYRLSEISSARTIDIHALRWGGWGYRGTQLLLGRAAWVLRSGSALELIRTNGRRIAVTIDDADEAAAVVNGLLARANTS